MPVIEPRYQEPRDQLEPEPDEDGNLLPMQWEPPQTHEETQLQAEAIQDMLRSSVTPPDTPTRRRNRENVATFKQGILAGNILQTQLTNYMWDSYITKAENDNRDKRGRTQVQKGGVVYAHDIDRNIVGAEDRLQAWESLDLSQDQKLYRLVFSYSVLSQLMLHIKKLKKIADQSAVNILKRMTMRNRKKKKKEDHVNNS